LERLSITSLGAASQNRNEEFHKQKIRCPEGTARRLLACSANMKQEVAMTAIAHAFSRAFQSAGEFDTLKRIALFCGVGLLVSLVCLTYGLDLSPGFF
jgi:hypothetical protein